MHAASCGLARQTGHQFSVPPCTQLGPIRNLWPNRVTPFVHLSKSPLLLRRAQRHSITTSAFFNFGKASTGTPGLTANCWEQAKQKPKYSPLNKDIEVDVCIVGAGIAGLTTAYRLAQAGVISDCCQALTVALLYIRAEPLTLNATIYWTESWLASHQLHVEKHGSALILQASRLLSWNLGSLVVDSLVGTLGRSALGTTIPIKG